RLLVARPAPVAPARTIRRTFSEKVEKAGMDRRARPRTQAACEGKDSGRPDRPQAQADRRRDPPEGVDLEPVTQLARSKAEDSVEKDDRKEDGVTPRADVEQRRVAASDLGLPEIGIIDAHIGSSRCAVARGTRALAEE